MSATVYKHPSVIAQEKRDREDRARKMFAEKIGVTDRSRLVALESPPKGLYDWQDPDDASRFGSCEMGESGWVREPGDNAVVLHWVGWNKLPVC